MKVCNVVDRRAARDFSGLILKSSPTGALKLCRALKTVDFGRGTPE